MPLSSSYTHFLSLSTSYCSFLALYLILMEHTSSSSVTKFSTVLSSSPHFMKERMPSIFWKVPPGGWNSLEQSTDPPEFLSLKEEGEYLQCWLEITKQDNFSPTCQREIRRAQVSSFNLSYLPPFWGDMSRKQCLHHSPVHRSIYIYELEFEFYEAIFKYYFIIIHFIKNSDHDSLH